MFFVWVCLANLLKTAVSVLASTVRLTVSFMEPLMTVSVMLRCSQQAVSSSALDLPQSLGEVEEGEATVVANQPSQSRGIKKGNNRCQIRPRSTSFKLFQYFSTHSYLGRRYIHLPNVILHHLHFATERQSNEIIHISKC